MSESTYETSNFKSVEHLLGYFDQQVLAAYRNEPHKYTIVSDYFEGDVQTSDNYYREFEEADQADQSISLRFGYRTLKDGNLALVVFLTDLTEKSKAHVKRWYAFHLDNPEWTGQHDERFDKWVKRNLEGSWDVDNGPLYYLVEVVTTINCLTAELIGIPPLQTSSR